MDRPAFGKILKYPAYFALVFLTYVLQSMVLNRFEILGTKPILLPIAAVGIAMMEGSVTGAAFGLISGVLCDLSFNQPTVAFTIILTIIGMAAGVLCEKLLEKRLLICVIFGLGALVISALLQMFSLLVYMNAHVGALIVTAIKQTLYSVIFTVPIYYICRAISRIPGNS